ncbi:hypothetical protein T05_6491 [Trichinella murrelli]|uniref:Uncharacterized protein n=1 Tax=Trichinella murrelli TaxID=144512 RepID=A0A0V0TH53_9BILA|nr:hypothetical protein T05_6491 [Trichinella murrelli]
MKNGDGAAKSERCRMFLCVILELTVPADWQDDRSESSSKQSPLPENLN